MASTCITYDCSNYHNHKTMHTLIIITSITNYQQQLEVVDEAIHVG